MNPFEYVQQLEAHMDEGGKINRGDVRDLIQFIKEQHARGLEQAKALAACIEAISPADRGGISLHEWNQRLKAAQKQACAALSDNRDVVRRTAGGDDG